MRTRTVLGLLPGSLDTDEDIFASKDTARFLIDLSVHSEDAEMELVAIQVVRLKVFVQVRGQKLGVYLLPQLERKSEE